MFNQGSAPLSSAECLAMRADPAIQRRFRRSYELILDFWGFTVRRRQLQPPPASTVDAAATVDDSTAAAASSASTAPTGEAEEVQVLRKADDPMEMRRRFENLGGGGNHNFLRISRVIKCLQVTRAICAHTVPHPTPSDHCLVCWVAAAAADQKRWPLTFFRWLRRRWRNRRSDWVPR